VAGGIQLVISRPILHELLDVLARKFGRDAEELAQVMHPKRKISVLDDEPDNRILECALAGHADVIVSGDRVMLALGEYQGVRILSLRGFLEETAPNPA
jgi:predicted nucleic acid-binding protein